MGLFERYLSVWVLLSILAGMGLGIAVPDVFAMVAGFEFAHVNLVVAVLIWLMIYPMMIQVDFAALKDVGKKPKGLILTLVINWLVKPFTMAALGWLFFEGLFADWVSPEDAQQYIAGMMLLVAGVLLVTPGFVTDIFGLSLLIPQVRASLVKAIQSQLIVSQQKKGNLHFYTSQTFEHEVDQSARSFNQPKNQETLDRQGKTLDGEFERKD